MITNSNNGIFQNVQEIVHEEPLRTFLRANDAEIFQKNTYNTKCIIFCK